MDHSTRPTVLVTGASRGIGKATAIAFAEAGYDVAITARTLRAGEGRDDSDSGNGQPIPGSLEETGAAIEAAGTRALLVAADLFDHESLERAVRTAIETFGYLDVIVNNAVDTGPGSMVLIEDLTVEQLHSKLTGNVTSQFVVVKAALSSMLARGHGTIINITSHAGVIDPPAPAGSGGWGMAYAASKAAFHRFATFLALELGERGIVAYNLSPGFVDTERQLINAKKIGLGGYHGAPPSVPAAVAVWLATHPEKVDNGATVMAQRVALDQGLHPDWRPPKG
jgi:NAD(P)-dependent dehydrogenase (short-subunit alcohol dehydrogenase family)